jgi:hypothetical protein
MVLFIGSTALIEADQASLSFISETQRLITGLGLSFLLLHYHIRLINSGEIKQLLALPLTRSAYIITCLGAFLPFILGFALINFTTLMLIFPLKAAILMQWAALVAFENLCLLSVALFLCYGTESFFKASTLLLGVYFLGRLRDFILHSSVMANALHDGADSLLTIGIKLVFAPFPGFDRLAASPLTVQPFSSYLELGISGLFFILLSMLILRTKGY